jgi:glycosyltransferase involved in cell wall biosynthesis
MVVPGGLKGGAWKTFPFVEDQAESLRRVGWKVVLALLDDRTSVRGLRRNARRLKGELSSRRPAIIHAQYGSVTGAMASWVKGSVPLVVSFCGDDLLGTPNPGWRWRAREWCARRLGLFAADRASAVIVKSCNLFEALPVSLRGRATILPNGVDMEWFTPLDKASCRETLGWDPQARIVLFNGSQEEDRRRKNPTLAHAVVDLLARSQPDISLFMMSGATREEVRLMLNAADCLLVTSLHEGSPNIVKEAMACNLPVVSVRCGDVFERVSATKPGGVCPYDAGALARAIEEVFTVGLRSNGREQLHSQGLAAPDVAERLSDIYLRVLAKGPALPVERA